MLVKVQLVSIDGNTDSLIEGDMVYINTRFIKRMVEKENYAVIKFTDSSCDRISLVSLSDILEAQEKKCQ